MFWRKEQNKNKFCQLDKGLSECSSVSNLKLYQQQLKDIIPINIDGILYEFFGSVTISVYDFGRPHYKLIDNMVLNKNKYNNYEEKFRQFGKELDQYFNQEKHIEELKNKIKQEKKNLGIE